MTAITRHFAHVQLHGKLLNLHYRSCGDKTAQAVVLLHPSPLSSAFVQPMLQMFGEKHYAVALDTPGNGDSDALEAHNPGLVDFVECLDSFIEALGLGSVILYGNATGAQIAVEYSKAHPQKVSRMILENAAIFEDHEREAFYQHYFPDLTPTECGGHVSQIWNITENLYQRFPWYDSESGLASKLPKPSAAMLNLTAMDYMKAGQSYDRAYKAALENERPEQIKSVTVPTSIILWEDGLIYPYSARLKTVDLPDNITLVEAASGLENRMDALRALR